MTATDEATVTRVRSRDGTEIAYWTTGDGPPLVLVHGAPADHTRWRPLLPYLAAHATVHAMDRRGRGASGDGPKYDMAREYEDVAAVIDAVAETAGSTVDVYGHSLGGYVAFQAATLTRNIRRLMLYEGWPVTNPAVLAFPASLEQRLDALVATGDRDAALEMFMREVALFPPAEIAVLRAQPSWRARAAAIHTITREIRAVSSPDAALKPEQAARITVPTLLLTGEHSRDPAAADIAAVATALPNSRVVVIDGQQHLADVLIPDTFAKHVVAFLRETSP